MVNLLSLAVNGYTADAVKKQLEMQKGSREVAFKYLLYDKNDVYLSELPQVSGSIGHDAGAEIKRTGRFYISRKIADDVDLSSNRLQPIYRLKMPDGGWAEWSLGYFLLASPSRTPGNVGKIDSEIDAYDKGQILKEDCFTSRHVVAAGTNYVTEVVSIINGAGIGTVNITATTLTLVAALEFEIGYSKLTAVNDLLKAINYNSLTFDDQGYAISSPYVEPALRTTEYEYKTSKFSLIKPGATETLDTFSAPNVFVRYISSPDRAPIRSQYTNTNTASMLSTINRGRSIVSVEQVDDIADQTTLDAYTRRQAINAEQIYGGFDFTTAIMPHHSNLDCLFVEHSGLNSVNTYIEQSWNITLDSGADMTHSVRKVVAL